MKSVVGLVTVVGCCKSGEIVKCVGDFKYSDGDLGSH